MKPSNSIPFILVIMTCFFTCSAVAASEREAQPGSGSELSVWKDPSFKKQFMDSFIAETEVEPRVTETEREQMQKVLNLMSDEKTAAAVSMLEKNRNPASSAVFDFTLANIFFQQEKLDEAAAAYETAVKKYPKFRRAWRNLGLIYVRKNEFEKALPAFTRVLELGGADALTYGLLGYAYSSAENSLCAESAFRMAIMLDAGTLDWKLGLCRSLFKQERYAEAAVLSAKLIEEKPDRADLWLLQANAYIGLNRPLKAAENYEFVERLGKSTAESLTMLGDIYTNEELFDMAVRSYVRAVERNPKAPSDRALRAAKLLVGRGALKETEQLLEQLEALRAGNMSVDERKDILKLRARIAVAKGEGDAEAKTLEEIVALDPLDGEALILLGQHAGRAGNAEKAVLYLERAASIEKYEADAKVRLAQLLVGNGKYDEALPLLRKAQQLKPRDDVQKYIEQVERIAKAK